MYTSYASMPIKIDFPHCTQAFTPFSQPLHILLVEDNQLLQHLHQHFLEQLGYSVTAVASGEEALLSFNTSVDAVLMDIDLPGMDGFKTTETLLRQGPIPIIGCSSHKKENVNKEYQASGMVDYIEKPASLIEFKICLERHMRVKMRIHP